MQNNQNKRRFFDSIRFQLSIMIFCIIAGIILMTLFINRTFLEKYYFARKEATLQEVFQSMYAASSNDSLSTENTSEVLSRITTTEGIDLVVLDAESRSIQSYSNDPELMQERLFQQIVSIRAGDTGDVEVLSSDTGKTLQVIHDKKSSLNYLEMWGILPDNSIYLMRTPLESIRQSTGIANRFFTLIGIPTALFGALIAFFAATGLVKPLSELSALSDRMRNLDFTAKFTGRQKNEIGELGRNVNELSASLERSISELKTANQKLMQDIKQKEEVEQMRQAFISDLTHEFKTPIALIQGYAEGLEDNISGSEEERRAYLEVIKKEASGMNNMVHKLLTLNHLEFGKTDISMQRFDITELISGYLETAKLRIEEANAKIEWEAPSPVYVWSDPFLTEDVFDNYFSNALHYVKGDNLIRITVTEKEKKVHVTVFNRGTPISEEALPHIWEKFYKEDKARSRQYGGSGVGLSIVKAIMDSLHQDYGVVNYEDGVAFYFETEM